MDDSNNNSDNDRFQEFKIIDNISKLLESSFGVYGKSKLISLVFDHIDTDDEDTNGDKQNNNKNVVLSTQKIIFTNDGLTIYKSLNNDSPYYKIILQQSNFIKQRFGVGVSQYIILTNNLLKRSIRLFEKGLFNYNQILNTYKECRVFIRNSLNNQQSQQHIIDVKDVFSNLDNQVNFNIFQQIIKANLSKNILSIYNSQISLIISKLLKILPALQQDKIKIVTIVSTNEDNQYMDSDDDSEDNSNEEDDGGDDIEIQILDGILIKSTFSFAGRDKLSKVIENPRILLLDYEIELKHQKEFATIEIPSFDQYFDFINAEKLLVSNQLEIIYKSNVNLILNKKVIGDLAIQEFVKKQQQVSDNGNHYKINCIGSISTNKFEEIKNSIGGITQGSLQSLNNDDTTIFSTCSKYKQITIGKKSYELLKGTTSNTQTIVLKGSSKKFLIESKQGLQSLLTAIRSIIIDNYKLVGGSGNFEFIIINLLNNLIKNKSSSTTSSIKEILIIKCLQKSIKDTIKLLTLNCNLNLDLVDQLFDMNEYSNQSCINILTNSIDSISNLNILESKSMKMSILNSSIETCLILLKTISSLK